MCPSLRAASGAGVDGEVHQDQDESSARSLQVLVARENRHMAAGAGGCDGKSVPDTCNSLAGAGQGAL